MPAYESLLDFVGDDWGTGCDIGNARERGGKSGSKSRTLDGTEKRGLPRMFGGSCCFGIWVTGEN